MDIGTEWGMMRAACDDSKGRAGLGHGGRGNEGPSTDDRKRNIII